MSKKLVKTLVYENEECAVEGEFLIGSNTFWTSQKVVAKIFKTTSQNISKHFNNVIQEGELIENEVSINSDILFQDNSEFINYKLINSKKDCKSEKWYNFDAMISIGCRINSKEATNFHKWSIIILNQYTRKSFVLNKRTIDDLAGLIDLGYATDSVQLKKELYK